jgi:flagellar biosynthetic protein FliR
MIEFDAASLMTWLGNFMWPFMRVGGFLMASPVIGTQLVPKRVRLILAILITLIVAPLIPALPTMDLISIGSYIIMAQQLLIGIAMGFVLQALLQMFVVGGQLIAMKMGLGFASMVDPSNGVSVTVISQFHLMMATLLFLAMNGHLVMIEVMVESFSVLPIGEGFMSSNGLLALANWGGWMFAAAMLMALPAVTALLIINFAVAIVTRAAPQLNIFAIGFPFMLLIGLIIIFVSIGGYLPHFDQHTREAMKFMTTILILK